MKFSVDADKLRDALSTVSLGKRCPAIPAARWVRIEARGKGTLEFSTTNLNQFQSVCLQGQEIEKTGMILVDHRRLLSLMKNMGTGRMVFSNEKEPERLVATCGRVTLELPVTDNEAFPSSRPCPLDAVLVDLHLGALQEARCFTSSDDARPILTGVYYDRGNLAATDSYRLTEIELPERTSPHSFIIPNEAIEAMGRLFGNGWIEAKISPDPHGEPDELWVQSGERRFFTRLITGQFPNYRTLIPPDIGQKGDAGIRFTSELRDAALKMYRFSLAIGTDRRWQDGTPVVVEEVSGDVVLSWSNDAGSAKIETVGTMGTRVAFNPRYLAEMFEGTSVDTLFGQDSLRLWGLKESAEYCIGATRTRLIMPVRIT